MKRNLVIQTASIGDVILITPVIEELHQQDPDSIIDVLVKHGNQDLFAGHPYLNQVFTWDKRRHKYLRLFKVIVELRRQRYDLVINAQRFLSSGLISVFSRARVTAGFDKNPLSFLFTHKVKHTIGLDSVHEAERNLSLIPGVVPRKGSAIIRLYPSREDYSAVNKYQQVEYICLSPASLWFTKQYPPEKWLEFIDALPGKYLVYLLGSKADNALALQLLEAASGKKLVNLCGKLNLLQSAALMEGAVMNYVNDSAPLHLCSSRNAPVTAVFCSTIPAFGFGPYGSQGCVVETEAILKCRPCGLHGKISCPEGHFLCAYGIKVQQLLNKLPK